MTVITPPRRNIELKARDRDRARSLAVCEELGARERGLLVQRDTYFAVADGRLKLREEQGAVSQLIAYQRPDRCEQRESRYRIVAVEHPDELKAVLAAALGTTVVVAKERRLFCWERNVRIHLDRVEGLGDFIELEAVAADGSELTREREQVATLRRAFAIADGDLVAASYSDLALALRSGARRASNSRDSRGRPGSRLPFGVLLKERG